ncbi:serine/threonine phosphatase stp [mine drainage metagenome]|uniref:Serine/threonine phosphatase stp n=1 Tax=mine drainage metagenome TaxID=410659 RepID=A0A1J5R2N0_9ZZZZ
MKFTIYQGSHQGGRQYNQDRIAYSYSKDAMLAVLADGMGGHSSGEIAAQLAINTLTGAFQRLALPILAHPSRFLNDYILQVHDVIDSYVADNGLIDHPRTTVVAAIAQHDALYVAHVGDSRLYHFRNGEIIGRTEDHSKVQLMFRRGLLNLGQVGMHPERNKIYNCVGGAIKPKVELSEKHELRDGDTILLCSDGLWSLVGDEKMAEILCSDTVNFTIPDLLDLAESRADSKSDNMSAIGFNWGGKASAKQSISTADMAFETTTTIMMNPQHEEAEGADAETASLSDADIEGAIAEIQAAIKNVQK